MGGGGEPEGEGYLKTELGRLGSFGYRWQLQKVPTNDELNPPKGLILLSDPPGKEPGNLVVTLVASLSTQSLLHALTWPPPPTCQIAQLLPWRFHR